MPSRSVGLLLNSIPELQSLHQQLRQLTAFKNKLAHALPDNLLAYARVTSFKAGELLLITDNGVVAAKLRQLIPTMLTALREQEYEINAIRLQVQVRTDDKPLPDKQITLSVEARRAIAALSPRISNVALRCALERLANRGI